MRLTRTPLIVGLCAALGGCATLPHMRQHGRAQLAALSAKSARHQASLTRPLLRWHIHPDFTGTWAQSTHTLPAIFNTDWVYNSAKRESIYTIAAKITKMTGLRVTVHDLSAPGSASGTSTTSSTATSPMGGMLGGGMLGGGMLGGGMMGEPPGMNPEAMMENTYPAMITARVRWARGPLSGLLTQIAARWGISWRWRYGAIRFFKFETKTYPLNLSTMTNTTNFSIADGGAGGGTTTSTQNGSLSESGTGSLSPYADALKGVQSILQTSGQSPGVAVASPALGDVTVTATPEVQRMVRAYLRSVTRQSEHNVAIDIRVYQVTLKHSTDLGGSLTAAFHDAAQTLTGVNLTGALQNPANGMGALSLIIPSGAATGTGTIPGTLSGTANGIQAVLNALKSVGRTTFVTKGSVITENGVPGPIQSANQVAYLKSSSVTATTNAGTTASLTPGTLTVGFTANALPRILSRHRVLLSYQMKLSSLVSIPTVTSGGSTIETPETQTQSDAQSVILKNGQTLVMAAFGQISAGAGAGIGLLSGYRYHNHSRNEYIVMIHVAEVQP